MTKHFLFAILVAYAHALPAQGEVKTGWYKLFNQKRKGPLFAGDGTLSWRDWFGRAAVRGDHYAWVEPRPDYENGGKERFFIQSHPDGTYQLFNQKWKGPLYPEQWPDGAGDRQVVVSPDVNFKANGNIGGWSIRWSIERQADGSYKLFNIWFRGPLFIGEGTDSVGDFRVWVASEPGYENEGKERWVLEPLDYIAGLETGWYKLFNQKRKGPLFAGEGPTWVSRAHYALVDPRPDYESGGKERFFIQSQPDGTYKLFNQKWKGPLVPTASQDSAGDRQVFVPSEGCSWSPDNREYCGVDVIRWVDWEASIRWVIDLQADGSYKLFNMQWKGPLFIGEGTDSVGDFRVWVDPEPGYENEGKERWVLEPIDSHDLASAASSTSEANSFQIVCAAVLGGLLAGMIALVAIKRRVREGLPQAPLLSPVC